MPTAVILLPAKTTNGNTASASCRVRRRSILWARCHRPLADRPNHNGPRKYDGTGRRIYLCPLLEYVTLDERAGRGSRSGENSPHTFAVVAPATCSQAPDSSARHEGNNREKVTSHCACATIWGAIINTSSLNFGLRQVVTAFMAVAYISQVPSLTVSHDGKARQGPSTDLAPSELT